METKILFTSLLSKFNLDVDNSVLEKLTYDLSKSNTGVFSSNEGGWQSKSIQDRIELQPLIDQIDTKLVELYVSLGFSNKYKPVVGQVWINLNRPGDYNKTHTHPNSFFTGVYYVKAEKTSGAIEFLHPIREHNYTISNSTITQHNNYNSGTHWEHPEVGSCLIFSPWMMHSVQPNRSGEDRISIAFNCYLDEIGEHNGK